MRTTRQRKRRRPAFEDLEGRALLSAGALDTSFGGTGQVITQLPLQLFSDGVIVQPDLKAVVVGQEATTTGYDLSLFRYNVDGSLDSTFGSGGEVVLATSSIPDTFAKHNASIAIQPDGKIVAATNTASRNSDGSLASCDMLVLRFNSNGGLDPSFGQNGETTVHLSQGMTAAHGVAVLPSGQIVVAGSNPGTGVGYAGPEFVVARLTSAGALDTSFGPNGQGYNFTDISPAAVDTNTVDALGVDASGNLLLGGMWQNPSTGVRSDRVVRYTPGGLIDTSFANQGVFDLPFGNPRGVQGIGFQSSGRIILSFFPASGLADVAGLNPDGTLDTTFGSNGYFYDPNAVGNTGLTVQPDDKILLQAGLVSNGDLNSVLVDRLLPGGALDPAFGTAGQVQVLGNFAILGGAIAVGPDGKIAVTQVTVTVNPYAIDTFRLLGDGLVTGHVVVTQPPPASLTAGTPFGLTVQVDDSSGNLESSFNGTVTVALANNPGGATLGGTLTVNANQGVASFSGLTLTSAAAGYTIDVSGPSLGDALTSLFTVTPSAPVQVVVTQQPPSSVTAGSGFGLQASIEDTYGNIVTSASGTVTVALATGPAGATLGGALSASTSNGVATFSGLTLTQAASGYTLSVSSSGLGGSTTGAFTVTPAAATQLVIVQQPPSSVRVNKSFTVVVAIEDAYGNVVANASNSVSAALGNGPTRAKLGGTTRVTAKNGYATFSNLAVNKAGSGYTLVFSSSGLSSVKTSAFSAS